MSIIGIIKTRIKYPYTFKRMAREKLAQPSTLKNIFPCLSLVAEQRSLASLQVVRRQVDSITKSDAYDSVPKSLLGNQLMPITSSVSIALSMGFFLLPIICTGTAELLDFSFAKKMLVTMVSFGVGSVATLIGLRCLPVDASEEEAYARLPIIKVIDP